MSTNEQQLLTKFLNRNNNNHQTSERAEPSPLPSSQNDLLLQLIQSFSTTLSSVPVSSSFSSSHQQAQSPQQAQLPESMCRVSSSMDRPAMYQVNSLPAQAAVPPPMSFLLQQQQLVLQERSPFPVPASPLLRRRRAITEREQFLLFVKILLKCLEQTGNPRLRQHAKAVVGECTRRNRMGDINYIPLQDAVEVHLKNVVGDTTWTRAKLYVDHYIARRGLRLQVAGC